MARPLVCIDAGHGGRDPGAVTGGVRESDLALEYAVSLATEIESRGGAVRLTRDADRTTTLAARANAANAAGAAVFVSLHLNAAERPNAHGFQVFHAAGSARGERLAGLIWERVAAARTQWAGVYPDESPACGGRRLYVLRATKMPAVLLELGFLTNELDRAVLLDPAHRQAVCRAVADALDVFLGVTTP